MNRTLRTARLVAASMALCIVFCPIHARAAKNPLRFDGLYRCTVPTNIGATTSYLRFYPDGVVLAVISLGTPQDVAKWFSRQKQPNFNYSVSGNSIRFEEKTGSLSYIYSGTIQRGSLKLRVDGYDHKASMGYVERIYKFLPIALRP